MLKKLIVLIGILFFLNACSKQKRVQNKLVGTWNFTKQINYDGSEFIKNEWYVFEAGNPSNKNLLHIYGSDTLDYRYLVNKKGTEVLFTLAETDSLIETWLIDYQKKDLLVLKTGFAICIFER